MPPVDADQVLADQEAAVAEPPVEDEADRGDEFEADETPPVEAKAEEPEAEEAEAEAAEEPEEPEPKRSTLTIPKHRYDSQAARTRAAEAEAQRLREELARTTAASPPPAPLTQEALDTQLATLDDELDKALLDNDASKVREIRSTARRLEREFLQNMSGQQAEMTTQQAVQQVKLDETIAMLETEYPILSNEAPEFDPAVVQEVLELHEGFMLTGRYTASDAMLRAVSYVMKDATPPAEPAPPGKRRTPVEKNVATAKAQPPSLDGVGADSNKSGIKGSLPEASKLTEEEFDALPASALKRMRGDLFAG